MTLQEQIRTDLKDAMRAGNTVKRDVLRMLESAAKNVAIDKKMEREVLDDSVVLEAIRRAVKQRKDSIEQFKQGGRDDLAKQETQELAVLVAYLPASLDEDAVRELAQQVIAQFGPTTPSDFGKIMGKVMAATNGQSDGDVVKKIVQELLNA
ncbi:MAG: GatB/YqeY domain-containing protein [Candidatus Moranbacteria bacterium]|nr:GatB/YqeY domain-containing protein [Candidatus Moranbacteria bacterium]